MYCSLTFRLGRLAQLVRAPALHAGCREFESLIAHDLMDLVSIIISVVLYIVIPAIVFVMAVMLDTDEL